MQVPKRRSENYPRPKPDRYITEAKFDELKRRLERVKKSRPHAIEEVKRLALLGDFSENYEYQMAKGHLRGLNRQILELEDQINHAIIITQSGNNDIVRLGSNVTVEIEGLEKTFQILGSAETDPSAGIISQHSPVGAALLGTKIGDVVKVKLANRDLKYKIIRIF